MKKSWFDDLFDWNGDGKLDLFESAAKYSVLSDLLEDDEKRNPNMEPNMEPDLEQDPWADEFKDEEDDDTDGDNTGDFWYVGDDDF